MKMQKLKPKNEQHSDFLLFTIITTLVDYVLAFRLNNLLGIKLARLSDLPVYLSADKPVFFSLFSFISSEQTEYYLIQDTSVQNQIMNNFMLFVKGHVAENKQKAMLDSIGLLPDIFNINPLNQDNMVNDKNKSAKTIHLINTILTDLEYHLLEINRLTDESRVKLKPMQHKTIRKLYN